jgi:hypothetical protein
MQPLIKEILIDKQIAVEEIVFKLKLENSKESPTVRKYDS